MLKLLKGHYKVRHLLKPVIFYFLDKLVIKIVFIYLIILDGLCVVCVVPL